MKHTWPRYVGGTAALILILAASRWGSYIGAAPLYLTDLLLVAGVTHAIVSRTTQKQTVRRGPTLPLPAGAFFGYAILVGLMSFGRYPVITWARDLVPFLYIGISILSMLTLSRASTDARQRTWVLIKRALTLHAAWAIPLAFANQTTGFLTLPGGDASVLELRPDIDGALLAISAGLLVRPLLRNGFDPRYAILIVLCAGGVLELHSRAGLLSLLLAVTWAFICIFSATENAGRRLTVVLILGTAVGAMIFALPATVPGQRLLATVGVEQATTAEQINAEGTKAARLLVWQGVNRWSAENPDRRYFGSGFGNNFLEEAGVLDYLEGTTYDNVRSPHDWFIGNLARLGVIGFLLSVLAVLQLLWIAFRGRRRMGQDPLLLMAGLTIIAIIPIASLGVVLEAPFGAVPFWWAAGVLYYLRWTLRSGCQMHEAIGATTDHEHLPQAQTPAQL